MIGKTRPYDAINYRSPMLRTRYDITSGSISCILLIVPKAVIFPPKESPAHPL